ncbi:MAG: hypothetical protein RDU14_05235 [Melioribacteraceae bacterium]|nr:hypothetical protein [Melioribacteraceae bacterium]
MADIVTYNSPLEGNPNQCFCQMKFDDGLRILISQSHEGIKIIKLLFGFIPIKTLFAASFEDILKHEKIIGEEYSSPLLLDCYVHVLKEIKSGKQLYALLEK